jgi:hypothetical protein
MVIAESAVKITARDVARIHEIKELVSEVSLKVSELLEKCHELEHRELPRVEKMMEKGARLCLDLTTPVKEMRSEIYVLRAQVEQRKYERKLAGIDEAIDDVQKAVQELRIRSMLATTLDGCPE